MNDPKDDSTQPCPYRPTQAEPATEQPEHPFIAFKHFVDDQFRAITRLTSFSDLRQKMQAASEARSQHEREAHYRWTGRDVSPDHDEMVVQRMGDKDKHDAFDATLMLIRESSKRNAHVDPAKIEALYHDSELTLEHDRFAGPLLSFGGACYYMPETDDNLPSTANLSARGSSMSRWPHASPSFLSIDWFKDSIYSPINIETNPAFDHNRQLTWRHAFEDLLNESLSKTPRGGFWEGVRPNHPNTKQLLYLGPGLEWMLSLYCRGILPLHPSLQSRKGNNNFGILESVRQQWTGLANSWAPVTPEKKFAELVRAVASPPAPEHMNVVVRELNDFARIGSNALLESPPESTDDQFFEEHRPEQGNIFSCQEARDLWHAIYNEDADTAAKLIVAWEGKGRDVEDLIDDDWIVEDYLHMETDPRLWPLCEALEKSHSELLFHQDALMTRRKLNDDRYTKWQEEWVSERMQREETQQQEAQPGKRQKMLANQHSTSPDLITQESPGILAALTTTQTTRMPDGSVTTKVVLKKRFADGREETTESVKVEYPEQPPVAEADSIKKRGWFWS